MRRTTVMIPPELKRRASEQARFQDISLGEFMRRAREAAVQQNGKTRAGDGVFFDEVGFTDSVFFIR